MVQCNVLFVRVYGKTLTIFPCQGALHVPKLVICQLLDKENVFVCKTSKENLKEMHKKYFYGFGKQ